MNEQTKTITFIAVAAGFAMLGWFARPAAPTRDLLDDSGQEFFEGFTDPLAAASLEIIDYDEDTSTPHISNMYSQISFDTIDCFFAIALQSFSCCG